MPGPVTEAPDQGQVPATLITGQNVISRNQEIIFTKYVKLVLPLDGFVFWVKADLLSNSALVGAAQVGQFYPGQSPSVELSANQVTVAGSLHYSIDQEQDETATYALNHIIFNSQSEIQDLNSVNSQTMYLGGFNGQRFAFSNLATFYQQAGIWHYRGDAVYPIMESQIIDSLGGFQGAQLVVSNSLPIWLTLNRYMPMFPSFLIPDNQVPPFAAVHIGDDDTRALAALPSLTWDESHYQLVADHVKVTIYGLRNDAVMDFFDYVLAYIGYDGVPMGLMAVTPPRDAKRIQSEIGVLAMKKVIEFDVSYYQQRVRDLARQFILSCIPTFYIED